VSCRHAPNSLDFDQVPVEAEDARHDPHRRPFSLEPGALLDVQLEIACDLGEVFGRRRESLHLDPAARSTSAADDGS